MDNENKDTNVQRTGYELQKKRKGRKRGKQRPMSEDVDNGSSDSNIVETDAVDNTNIEESLMQKWKLDDSPWISNETNENTEYFEITTDTLGTQSSLRVENVQQQFSDANNDPPDDEYLKHTYLISDNNVNIFTRLPQRENNVFTDGIATSCVKSSENMPKIENNITQLTSEDVEKLYPSTSTAAEPVEQLYNSRALLREAKSYELENFGRNVLIIFNQKNFGNHQRVGTDQDVKALKNTFEAFDFDVLPYTDRTVDEIKGILEAISSQDLSDYGCVAIAVLTHGDIDGKLFAKDGDYSEMDIINSLKTHKNHSLITKPRLLFIQACRGPNALVGVPALRKGKVQSNLNYDTKPYTLPVEADMLVVHSSYAGNRAHRDEIHGTWFIQTLCKKIKEMAPTHDLETILTHIKHEVAVDKENEIFNKVTQEYEINKQMPVVTTTLIRKLYLRPFDEENASNVDEVYTNVTVDTPNVVANAEPEPCLCALNYYDYIKECLRHYLQDNYEDTTARSLLDLTETFKNEAAFNATKEKCGVAIADHLEQKAKYSEHYKYLYIKRK